jgi:hypothetical protein
MPSRSSAANYYTCLILYVLHLLTCQTNTTPKHYYFNFHCPCYIVHTAFPTNSLWARPTVRSKLTFPFLNFCPKISVPSIYLVRTDTQKRLPLGCLHLWFISLRRRGIVSYNSPTTTLLFFSAEILTCCFFLYFFYNHDCSHVYTYIILLHKSYVTFTTHVLISHKPCMHE